MATPAYPGAVKAFGADLENLVNIVYAAHVNDLRAEVVAVETEIGLGLRKSITWANRPAFDRPTSANFTWGDLSLRLTNIEAGLVSTATDIHPQYFLTTGGSLTGPINMGGNRISNLGNGTVSQDAVNLGQLNIVSTVANASLPRAGGAMSGDINMGGRYLLNIGQSGAVNDAATVGQVNTASAAAATAQTAANAANANANTRIPMNGLGAVSQLYVNSGPIQFKDDYGIVRYSIDRNPESLSVSTVDANGWRSTPLVIRYSDSVVRASYNAEVGGSLTVSGSAFVNGAGLHVGGEFAKYVDGQLRVHMHNGGVSVYSDLGVTGALVSEGQMRMSDAGRPEDNYAAQNNDRRWLVYHGDGIVRRMNETTFRLMVAAIATGSSAQFKSHIADPVDSPDVTVLRPREFRWTDDDEMRHRTHPGMRYGLIAEEVAAVDERFVMRDFDDNVVGLDQHALIAGLIAKVTELEQRIDTMQETA